MKYLLVLSIIAGIFIPYFFITSVVIIFIINANTWEHYVSWRSVTSGNKPLPDTDLIAFRHMKFHYLKSPSWQKKRKLVLARDHYRCCKCLTSTQTLNIHHLKDYHLVPHEPISSLMTLCDSCHELEHIIHGYPQTYSDYMTWDTTK